MYSGLFRFLFSLGILASFSITAVATPVNYGDFLGTSPGEVDFLQVTEDSTTDDMPLFGGPIHVGNRLLFFPQTFASSAANGLSDTTSGTLTITIRADTDYHLETISIEGVGDYTLTGVGTSATLADAYGGLSVMDTDPAEHGAFSDLLTVLPTPPYALPLGTFDELSGAAHIDLCGLGISEVDLTFSNTLETDSEAGTTAFIQNQVLGIEVTTVWAPEPASALLLGSGLFTVLTYGRLRRIQPIGRTGGTRFL